jgi:hypothetical protein
VAVSIGAGFSRAIVVLESGAARAKLAQFVETTQRLKKAIE